MKNKLLCTRADEDAAAASGSLIIIDDDSDDDAKVGDSKVDGTENNTEDDTTTKGDDDTGDSTGWLTTLAIDSDDFDLANLLPLGKEGANLPKQTEKDGMIVDGDESKDNRTERVDSKTEKHDSTGWIAEFDGLDLIEVSSSEKEEAILPDSSVCLPSSTVDIFADNESNDKMKRDDDSKVVADSTGWIAESGGFDLTKVLSWEKEEAILPDSSVCLPGLTVDIFTDNKSNDKMKIDDDSKVDSTEEDIWMNPLVSNFKSPSLKETEAKLSKSFGQEDFIFDPEKSQVLTHSWAQRNDPGPKTLRYERGEPPHQRALKALSVQPSVQGKAAVVTSENMIQGMEESAHDPIKSLQAGKAASSSEKNTNDNHGQGLTMIPMDLEGLGWSLPLVVNKQEKLFLPSNKFRKAEIEHKAHDGGRLLGPYRPRIAFAGATIYSYVQVKDITEAKAYWYPYFKEMPLNDEGMVQALGRVQPEWNARAFKLPQVNSESWPNRSTAFVEEYESIYTHRKALSGNQLRPALKKTHEHSVPFVKLALSVMQQAHIQEFRSEKNNTHAQTGPKLRSILKNDTNNRTTTKTVTFAKVVTEARFHRWGDFSIVLPKEESSNGRETVLDCKELKPLDFSPIKDEKIAEWFACHCAIDEEEEKEKVSRFDDFLRILVGRKTAKICKKSLAFQTFGWELNEPFITKKELAVQGAIRLALRQRSEAIQVYNKEDLLDGRWSCMDRQNRSANEQEESTEDNPSDGSMGLSGYDGNREDLIVRLRLLDGRWSCTDGQNRSAHEQEENAQDSSSAHHQKESAQDKAQDNRNRTKRKRTFATLPIHQSKSLQRSSNTAMTRPSKRRQGQNSLAIVVSPDTKPFSKKKSGRLAESKDTSKPKIKPRIKFKINPKATLKVSDSDSDTNFYMGDGSETETDSSKSTQTANSSKNSKVQASTAIVPKTTQNSTKNSKVPASTAIVPKTTQNSTKNSKVPASTAIGPKKTQNSTKNSKLSASTAIVPKTTQNSTKNSKLSASTAIVPYAHGGIMTQKALEASRNKLNDLGLVEPSFSSVSGSRLFFPPKVIKKEHYTFIRLVCDGVRDPKKKLKASDAKRFYCILCQAEYTFSPGNSNQVTRHNQSEDHKQKLEQLDKGY